MLTYLYYVAICKKPSYQIGRVHGMAANSSQEERFCLFLFPFFFFEGEEGQSVLLKFILYMIYFPLVLFHRSAFLVLEFI